MQICDTILKLNRIKKMARDFLIDDRPNNGAKNFEGKWIHFGSEDFPDWSSVIKYLL